MFCVLNDEKSENIARCFQELVRLCEKTGQKCTTFLGLRPCHTTCTQAGLHGRHGVAQGAKKGDIEGPEIGPSPQLPQGEVQIMTR